MVTFSLPPSLAPPIPCLVRVHVGIYVVSYFVDGTGGAVGGPVPADLRDVAGGLVGVRVVSMLPRGR